MKICIGLIILIYIWILPYSCNSEMELNHLEERFKYLNTAIYSSIRQTLDDYNSLCLAELAIHFEQRLRKEKFKEALTNKEQQQLYNMNRDLLKDLVTTFILSYNVKNLNRRNLFFSTISLKKMVIQAFSLISETTQKLENPKFFDTNIENNLKVDKITTNTISGKRHAHTQQKINGIKVWNKDIILHLDSNNENQDAKTGEYVNIKIKDIASYNPDFNLFKNIAYQDHGRKCMSDTELILYEHKMELRPTIRVNLNCLNEDPPSIPNYFIDLETQEILHVLNDLETIRNRKTYDAITSQILQRSFILDEQDKSSGDTVVDKIHDNMKKIYDYFWNTFSRDSYDDAGAELKSTVHFGKNFNNAFYDGKSNFAFGDGDNKVYGPIIALDIAAHEFSHAIIKSESKLEYQNESGALNEALSDIFAACVDEYVNGESDKTYTIGEEIFLSNGSLRSMANPSLTGDYDFYPTRYTGTSDNGGVHYNSGIVNLAFYLLCKGGKHPRNVTPTVVTKIGIKKACKIFYYANEDYLVPNSGFFDMRHATINASNEIFGIDSPESVAVGLSWEAVGLYEKWILKKKYINLSSTADESYSFSIEQTSASKNFKIRFKIFGQNGDADLYIRKDFEPTPQEYDCRPFLEGSNEECKFDEPGTYHIIISAYKDFTNLTFECYILEL